MNVFGAFNFGRLIKTFLPGFILFCASLVYMDLILYAITGHVRIVDYLLANNLQLVTFAIPGSIIFGIFSNTIFFSIANDRLIEERDKRQRPEFYEYEKLVLKKLNTYFQSKLDWAGDEKELFDRYNDSRFLLLQNQELEKYVFIQESYWYYLEFQMNILLALAFALPGFLGSLGLMQQLGYMTAYHLCILMALTVIAFIWLGYWLLRGAMLNFQKYRSKYLSFVIGTFYFSESSPAAKSALQVTSHGAQSTTNASGRTDDVGGAEHGVRP